MKPGFLLAAVLVAMLASTSDAVASGSVTVSGALTPVVQNAAASPHGRGGATLTISADRTRLDWRITYAGVSSPIMAVYFCSGSNPRVTPIDVTCGFVIPAAAGGQSPISGSRAILPEQADLLSSGFAVIQLASANGPQLYGYVQIGPPIPDTAGEPPSVAADYDLRLAAALGALAGAALILVGRPRRWLA